MSDDVSWVPGIELEITSGSLPLDFMLEDVRGFVRNNPVTKEDRVCPVCERLECDQPSIFRDGLGCSDLCRKVRRGELSKEEATGIQDNLTKNAS